MFLIMAFLKCIIPAKEVMAKDLENMIMKNQSLITKYGRCVESGACGATEADHLKYSIYEEINDSKADSEKEHTLVIAGTGKMADYETGYETPWFAHLDSDSNGMLWEATYHLVLENGITRIGNNAFYWNFEGELKIPSSVKEIGNGAFWHCMLGGELVIPSSVKTIGNYAFERCCFKKLTILDGVEIIGNSAFDSCILGGELVIPSSVKTIGNYAFFSCSFKKLTILDGVEIIGNNAFDFGLFLDELEPIVIPTSVTQIGNEVFGFRSTLSGGIVISNPNCNIGEDLAGDYNTIYGYANSTAQKYAEEHGIKFCLYKKEEVKIKNLKNANISLSQTSYKFNGNKQTPSVKVTYDGKKLTSGSDYTVTYKNNRYVGTAEVQIKGTGSYTGTVTKKFKIVSPGSVTIKFDKNTKSSAAKVSKSSIKVSRGMQYGKLPTATLKGYKFAGWYTGKKNGKKIESKSYVENNPAKTLYAGWKRVTYKIQYNCDGGKNVKANPASYTIASKKITLQEPSRTGYSFSGWYNAKGKKVSAIPAGSTGDITLKAKWTPIKYKVSFKNSNIRFEKAMSDMTMIYGKKYTLPKNSYKSQNKNMVFIGWNTRKDGKGIAFQNQEKVWNLTAKNNGTVILYAQFANKNICYSIRYNLDGGNWSGTKGKTSYTCTDKKYILPKPVKSGYTFVGWKDAEGNVVTNMPQSSIGNKRFTAKWKPIKYTIHFDGNGWLNNVPADILCTYDIEVALPDIKEKNFCCWVINSNDGRKIANGERIKNLRSDTGTVVLYALEQKTSYNISEITFSVKGFSLLADLELSGNQNNIKRDAEGRIIAIRTLDIGDGGITIGFGYFVRYNDTENQKMLKEKYNIDATKAGEFVDVSICRELAQSALKEKEKMVKNSLRQRGIQVINQSVYDALIIQAYNAWQNYFLDYYLNESYSTEQVIQGILTYYRKLANWNKYGTGWTNRVTDQVECARYEDYVRSH